METNLHDTASGPFVWNIAKASVQGRSHLAAGVERQDVHRAEILPTGELVIVVADGAGSASHARLGAEIAVSHAFTSLEEALADTGQRELDDYGQFVESAMWFAHDSIHSRAKQMSLPPESFHSTLTCVVIGERGMVAGKIGDGVVVVSSGENDVETLLKPENGEYVNSTFFITQLGTYDAIIVGDVCIPQSIAVSTDGLLEVAFDNPYGKCTPWKGFFSPLFQWLATTSADGNDRDAMISDFLNSERIQERCDDDLTLVIATRVALTSDQAVDQTISNEAQK